MPWVQDVSREEYGTRIPRYFARLRWAYPATLRKLLSFFLCLGLSCLAACYRGETQVAVEGEQSLEIAAKSEQSAPVYTYHADIAPIVSRACVSCHRTDGAAPFELSSYSSVRSRARQIAEVVTSRFMPPWPPTEGAEVFVGARVLSPAEIETLQRWAEAGAPEGTPPPEISHTADPPEWMLRTPDLILETPAYTLSEGGGDQFRNFVLPTQLDRSRWVQAVEVRPLNPKVTHHARLGIDGTNESLRRDADDPLPGFEGMPWGEDPQGQLVIWAPGMNAPRPIPQVAWRLYPDANLVLHTHLQPSGKPETVRFQVGFTFTHKAPSVRPFMLRVGSRRVDIPAGQEDHVIRDQYPLPVDVVVYSIFPHAHSLCQQLKVAARLPSGELRPLLTIEKFDENWHDQYVYREPVPLPKGTVLTTEFRYDNSKRNLRNRRSPPQRTVFGSHSHDEMGDVYLQVTPVQPDERAVLIEDYRDYELRSRMDGYEHMLLAYPDDPWALEGLGSTALALQQTDKAIEVYERRRGIPPWAAPPLAGLGLAYLAAGKLQQARDVLREALELDPKLAITWYGLGQVLEAENKVVDALHTYRRARELAPGMSDIYMKLGQLLERSGDRAQAIETWQHATDIAPDDPNPYLQLARLSIWDGDDTQSLQYLEQARQRAPYLHPPKVMLAVYCLQGQKVDQALAHLREAYREERDHPVIEFFLGQFARRQGDLPRARRYLEEAASRELPRNWPASHRRQFQVLLHRERYLLAGQMQDERLARSALAEWRKVEPNSPDLPRD